MRRPTRDPASQTAVGAGFDEAFVRARDDGVIQVVHLVGREGVGKTAQVDAWLEHALADRVLRAWFRYEAAATFRPLADLVELAAGIDAGDGDEDVREKLLSLGALDAEVLLRLSHVVGVRGRIYPNHEIFWAARFLLEALGRADPVVVVLERAERAEDVFLDMLEYLAGRRGRTLIVTTARPRLLRSRPHWRNDDPTAPLRTLRVDGPDFAERSWFSALADLDASERDVVECASIIGDAFRLDVLDALASPELVGAVAPTVERLSQKGFFRRRAGSSEGVVTFEIGALRELVYNEMPSRAAARRHDRLASFLEERNAARRFGHGELIGFHFEAALEHGDRGRRRQLIARAVPYLSAAGRRALARSDAPAAADLLERAAVLISERDTRRPRLLLDLCDALLDLGDTQRLARIADTGLREAVESENEVAAARFGVWVEVARSRLGGPSAGDVDEDARVAAFLEAAGEHLGAAEAHVLRAEHLWDRVDYQAAEASLETALANAETAGYQRLEAKIAAWLLFSFFWGPRPASHGAACCRGFAGRFDDDRLLEANRLTTLGGLLGMGGEFVEAREHIAAARAMQRELGQPLVISWNPQIGGTIALLAGDLELAEAEFRLGFEEAQSLADPGHAATSASLLAKALYEQGRLDAAFKFTRLAEHAAVGAPETAQVEWRCTRAKIAARRDDVTESEREIKSMIAVLDARAMPRDRADALVDLAEVRRLGADPIGESEALRDALGLYDVKGVAPAAGRVRRRLDELGDAD